MKTRVLATTMAVFLTAASLCMTAPTFIYAEESTEEIAEMDHQEEEPEELTETEASQASDETAQTDTTEESVETETLEETAESVPLAREAPGATFTVTFDSKGGSDVADQTVGEGETAAKPEDPVYDGYHFLGWFVEPTLENIVNKETLEYNTFDFSAPVTGDVTLTALWTAVLRVDTTGAGEGYIETAKKGEEPEFDEEYKYTSAQETAVKDLYDVITVAAKAAENSVFVRWIDKDTGKTYSTNERIDVQVKKDLNLSAEFDSALVVFDSNGGSPVENQYVIPGTTVKKPEDPVNGNLHFIGWFQNPSLENLYDPETYEFNTFDFSTTISEITTLTALWGAVLTTEVSGDPGCGQINVTAPGKELEFSEKEPMHSSYTNAILGIYDTFKVGAKASDGYRFVRWEDKDTQKTYVTDAVIEVEVTDNLNLVAVFEKVVKEAAPTAAPTNAPTATPAPTQAATTTTAPKTGDDTPVMTWFGILLMAALGLGAAGKRKFGNGKEI